MAIPRSTTPSSVCFVHGASKNTSSDKHKQKKDEMTTKGKTSPTKKVCLFHDAQFGSSTPKPQYSESTDAQSKHSKSPLKGKNDNMLYCPVHRCVSASKKQEYVETKTKEVSCLVHSSRKPEKQTTRQVSKVLQFLKSPSSSKIGNSK